MKHKPVYLNFKQNEESGFIPDSSYLAILNLTTLYLLNISLNEVIRYVINKNSICFLW